MKEEIVIASNNSGKIKELREDFESWKGANKHE